MALKFLERIIGKDSKVTTQEVSVSDLCRMAEECRARELAFQCCVNLIAGALGRCEFRTYVNGKEQFGEYYWLFNFDPNTNQNSTAFIHKLVHQLYKNNEALIIPSRRKNGRFAYVVADTWDTPEKFPAKQREYKGVVVDDLSYDKTFYEKDVLHLELHGVNIKPVLDGVVKSYQKLIQAAEGNYIFSNGQHWKVHVNQMAQGEDGWAEQFQKMVAAQVDPFFNSAYAVLPEMDGWQYENVDKNVEDGRDAKSVTTLYQDVFTFTANAFGIPPVLLLGRVQGTQDAVARFLTACVDPLADQLSEEITRKFYGYEEWKNGSYLRVDTSAINHFDLFANAANVEKLIGSGYSYNDVQRAANMPTIPEPWADEHLLTKNFGKAETVLKGESANE